MRSHCVDGHLGERHEGVDARARHHDLDRAELAADLLQRVVDGGAVGDVDLAAERGGAALAQLTGRPLHGVAVEVEEGDAVPPVGEVPADRLPHAGGGTRDHRDPSHVSPLDVVPMSLPVEPLEYRPSPDPAQAALK